MFSKQLQSLIQAKEYEIKEKNKNGHWIRKKRYDRVWKK
jgi:hypothetical protein